jgi:hypothetical protein
VKTKKRDTRAEAVALAHKHLKTKFKERLGVKYFVPDPINGKGDKIVIVVNKHKI